MLAIISPAKTLDFVNASPQFAFSQPQLTAYSQTLVDVCKSFSPAQLASLMSISDKLANLNVARFEQWEMEHTTDNSKAAIFAFKGEVYTGLNAETLTVDEIHYAQKHLRILSGLYGLLRPLDLIQPYRLEMGTPLHSAKGKNLYQFWEDIITIYLQQAIDEQGDNLLINLASEEYFSAIHNEKLQAKIIKPVFLDQKNGRYKVISFYAKKARGLMLRFILQNQISDAEQLKSFQLEGYYFDHIQSNEWIFKREAQ